MKTLERVEDRQVPETDRRRWDTVALVAVNVAGLAAFVWPLVLGATPTGENRAHATDAPLLVALSVPLLAVVALSEARRRRGDVRVLALLGALVAVSAFLRIPKGPSGEGFALVLPILAGWSLGARFGFLLGAFTLLVSAVVTGGVGPWLPFQMFAAGWVGAGAGLARTLVAGRARTLVLSVYALGASLGFGFLMTLWFWPFLAGGTTLAWEPGLGFAGTLGRYSRFYILGSLPWDVGRALLGTVPLVAILAVPVGALLDRARVRLGA